MTARSLPTSHRNSASRRHRAWPAARRRSAESWRHADRSCEETLEKAAVDRRQAADVGDRGALVHLVHRAADEAELDHRRVVVDKARIGRTAGRAEARIAPGDIGGGI